MLDNFVEGIKNLFESISNLKFVKYLKRRKLVRKTIIFYLLVIPIVLLVIGGFASPTRKTYKDNQLAPEQTFLNGSGSMTLASQEYSKKNNIAVLEYDTSDATSSIEKGINTNNLDWYFFIDTKEDVSKTFMEVIPVTDSKVYVVFKNLPEEYDVLVVRAFNKTATEDDVDVTLKNYEDYKREQENRVSWKKEDKKQSNNVDFYITEQSGLLKHKYIKDLSREKFALSVFNEEKVFQREQVNKMNNAIEKLSASIEEDNATIEQLTKELKYLVGDDLVKQQDKIDTLQKGIDIKITKIETAKENLKTLDIIIKNLNKSTKEVKNGTYDFGTPIRTGNNGN